MNYQTICANLLKGLPQRTTDVIERRFGLKSAEGETLEAIGQTYGITRERVRQIEKDAFSKIQPKLEKEQKIFQYFRKTLVSFGDLKEEKTLLEYLGGKKFQNQIFFLLTSQPSFDRYSEDEDFYYFWATKKEAVNIAKKVVNLTISNFEKIKKTFSLDEFFKTQKKELSKISNKINKNTFLSYLEISKRIQKNPEGKFGLREWVEINPRGVKDKAYVVFKRAEKPLHFAEVASLIEKLPFPPQGKVHIATVHNELIRDQRFVLVGRGLYALSEWGYKPGLVKDVILDVLKEAKKPLTKQEVIEKVLKQRFVKANTISLNLNDKMHFFRNSKGKYQIKEI